MTATATKKRRDRQSSPKFDEWERLAWAPPPEEPIDEWAEKNLVLPSGVSALPGPLDLSLTPYLREILRAYTDPEVEEITLCTSTQVGKTTCAMIPVLYSAVEDPWNALVVMPRDPDAQELNQDRYQGVIRESPALRDLLQSGSIYDLSKGRIRFPGMTVSFVGANSPAALSSRAIRTLVMDEVDKWPEWSGREADPVELARERTRTFWNRKIIKASTPTIEGGYICRELEASTNERYHLPCPHCGEFQELVFGGAGKGAGIKWPEDTPPEVIRRDRLAWYECRHCGMEIRDADKPSMLSKGKWIAKDKRASRKHVGYHLWAAYSPWLTFSDIAARFLTSKSSASKLMNFTNSWLGNPWKHVVNELRGALIRTREAEYEEGRTLGGWCLTAGVDVQGYQGRTYLYYVIRAWGEHGENWLVKHGFVEGWPILTQVLFQAHYRDPTDAALPLHMVLIDSGDGNKTDEVYDYCISSGCWAYKGASKPTRPIKLSSVERLGVNVNLAIVDSGFFKVRLHRLIHGDKWHLPRGMDEEYYSHMSAEQYVREQDKKSGREILRWKVIPDGTANHYFDAEVMCLASAELLEITNLPKPIETEATAAKQPEGAEGMERTVEKGWAPMAQSVQTFHDQFFSG